MRILHCIPGMDGGGGERQLCYLAEAFKGSNVEIEVALTRRGPNFGALRRFASAIHEIHIGVNWSPALFTSLRRVLKERKPDLVQTWFRQMDIMGGFAAKRAGIPWVISERASEQYYRLNLKDELRARLGGRARAVIANSESGLSYWRRYTGGGTALHLIENALPVDAIRAAPLNDEIIPSRARSGLILLAVGRLSDEKNLGMLIDTLAMLRRSMDASLLLCGEGAERERLAERAARQGVEQSVFFLGYVEHVWSLMKRADLMFFPSKNEGQPNVLMEALVCGCPLLVSDIPAHRALLTEHSNSFIESVEPERLAEQAMKILVRPRDPGAAPAGSTAWESRWSLERLRADYLRVYRSILEFHECCPHDSLD